MKINFDRNVAHLRARLVAKSYAQTYGIDYFDTFSSIAKLASIQLFVSLAATYPLPLLEAI